MGTLRITLVLWLGLVANAVAYTKTGNVYYTDGSQSDVQAAIAAATHGEIVNLPEGEFIWTSAFAGVSGKGITILGQGGGGSRDDGHGGYDHAQRHSAGGHYDRPGGLWGHHHPGERNQWGLHLDQFNTTVSRN